MQDILEVIRVMAALAWSDGVIDSAEGDALRRLIERAGLPDDARWQAMNFVEFETRLGDINLDALSEGERRAMYRAAEALAVVDERLDPAEEKVLARLRTSLHVRREDVAALAVPPTAPGGPGPVKVRAKTRKPAKARPRKKAPRPARKPARKSPRGSAKKRAKGRKTSKSKRKRSKRR
jgi:tellurite resistance protein